MSKPVVLVLSRDQLLTTQIPGLLDGRADVRSGAALEEWPDLVKDVTPAGLIADFRRVPGGGHSEDRFLDSLQQRYPRLRVAMLTGDDCPEPLERRAVVSDILHLRGRLDSASLLAKFRDLLNMDSSPEKPDSTSMPAHSESVGDAGDDNSSAATSGMARRFETNSPALQKMLVELEIAARHDVTILLIGETGAGKTFLSRLIHEVSPRRMEPFLHVACGALPADLIESDLFGHVKGSFTSAHADKEGKFTAARRGSILLDEIDVLGLEQQVKLLRVIETGEFEPVGSNLTQRSQARVIVASNLDLQPLVEKNRFRPDLYYRLSMLKFTIPPLRQRKMDVVPLAKRFIRQFSLKHHVPVEQIDASFLQALYAYPWPGNVRELEHTMQRAVIYCRDGRLTSDHLQSHILEGSAGPTNDPSVVLNIPATISSQPAAPGTSTQRSLEGQIALTERDIIEQTLFKNGFSRTRTAKELGISRVTLYNKMKRYGINR